MKGKAEVEIVDTAPGRDVEVRPSFQQASALSPLESIVRLVDRANELVGRALSWLVLAMVLVTFTVAMLRYGFALGWIWLQETYVWMHGVIIMVGVGYTLLHDAHVRVDIFYRSASIRFKAWVNLLGSVFLLLPTVLLVAWTAWPYVLRSWERLETSDQPGGLPGLYLLKSAILVFVALLALQGLALLLRSLLVLLRGSSDSNRACSGSEDRS